MPPKIEFADGRTVIERDSRQMLHLSLTNVAELSIKGLGLPPVMAPMAIALTEVKDGTQTAAKKKKTKRSAATPAAPQ